MASNRNDPFFFKTLKIFEFIHNFYLKRWEEARKCESYRSMSAWVSWIKPSLQPKSACEMVSRRALPPHNVWNDSVCATSKSFHSVIWNTSLIVVFTNWNLPNIRILRSIDPCKMYTSISVFFLDFSKSKPYSQPRAHSIIYSWKIGKILLVISMFQIKDTNKIENSCMWVVVHFAYWNFQLKYHTYIPNVSAMKQLWVLLIL